MAATVDDEPDPCINGLSWLAANFAGLCGLAVHPKARLRAQGKEDGNDLAAYLLAALNIKARTRCANACSAD